MKKIVLFVFFVVFVLGLGVFHAVKVQAQDVCQGPQCDWVYEPYTEYRCTPTGPYTPDDCHWVTEDRWICHIPNPGGGGCTCCYPDGCYFNCPGPTPTGGGGGGTPTPPPPPVDALPIGNHDMSTCSISSGWACDPNNYAAPLSIHFYAGGTYIGQTSANLVREAAVGGMCGGYTAHGFTFVTPLSLKDGASHQIHAYAINTPAGTNPLLSSTPKTIVCPPPTPTPTPPPTCGNGVCNTPSETCSNCPGDCGTCPITPSPTPVGAICLNGVCELGETIVSCAPDCCGTGTSTIRARAVVIPSDTITCAAANSSTTFLNASFTISPSCHGAKTASGGMYATWTSYPADTYTISDSPPAGYVLRRACWTTTAPAAGGSGRTADVNNNATLTWNLAYTAGGPWIQAEGGDVYGATTITSSIPAGVAPRSFVTDGASGFPGVVTYGTSYDFDSLATAEGEGYVSSKDWLVDDPFAPTDYYAVMYHRFGSPVATSNGNTTYTSKRASGIYYVNGNLSITTADWNVTAGQSIVVFVNGNLTINRRINLAGTGFVAFIVNGDVIVNPAIGVPYTSSVPVLEGVYITSPAGTFHTGLSTSVGEERFVGEGIFVAGNFDLQRDLDSVAQNNSTAAELFIYNPQLLVTMPDPMRDIPVTWQEVAP